MPDSTRRTAWVNKGKHGTQRPADNHHHVGLVSENTQIFNPSHQKLYKQNDSIVYDHEEILIENVKLVKMLCI